MKLLIDEKNRNEKNLNKLQSILFSIVFGLFFIERVTNGKVAYWKNNFQSWSKINIKNGNPKP